MNAFIYAYNAGSQSAKELARALGIKRIKHEGSRYRARHGHRIINWGASQVPRELITDMVVIFNHPTNVRIAANKLNFFQRVSDRVNVPPFTTSQQEALGWLRTGDVCVRHKLTGHAGDGLEIASRGQQTIPQAPLYTKYVKKKAEYRVHVVDGRVIDVQQKLKRRDWDGERDTRIRNHDNGYIFARADVDPPASVLEQAGLAVAESMLHFGGVDVIWNEYEGKAYVLEVNTAPGIEGTTVQKYKTAFENLLRG